MNDAPSGIALLSDDPDRAAPLEAALRCRGHDARVVDLRKFAWFPSDSPPVWRLVVNQVAVRPPREATGVGAVARDLLAALELHGVRCVNGRHCHAVGASKTLQAAVFQRAGAPTPQTRAIHASSFLPDESEGLLKPNAGGRGFAVSAGDAPARELFRGDGAAVWQERLEPADGRVHRVEMLGGEPLYHASLPVEAERFDYCLGSADPADGLAIEPAPPAAIADHCRRIADATALELGGIEYLQTPSGPGFIDINPVSTWSPRATEHLADPPLEQAARYIEGLLREA